MDARPGSNVSDVGFYSARAMSGDLSFGLDVKWRLPEYRRAFPPFCLFRGHRTSSISKKTSQRQTSCPMTDGAGRKRFQTRSQPNSGPMINTLQGCV
jgi:hypothetical protein